MFEFKKMKKMKHFLRIRVFMQNEKNESSKTFDRIIYLIQDAYADKLAKEYDIKTNEKMTQISFSFSGILSKYENEINQKRLHEY